MDLMDRASKWMVASMAYSNWTTFIHHHTTWLVTFQLKQADGQRELSRELASETSPCGSFLETCRLTGKLPSWRGLGWGSKSSSGRSGLKFYLCSASGILFATDVAAMGLNVPRLCIGVSLGICQNCCLWLNFLFPRHAYYKMEMGSANWPVGKEIWWAGHFHQCYPREAEDQRCFHLLAIWFSIHWCLNSERPGERRVQCSQDCSVIWILPQQRGLRFLPDNWRPW